MKIQFITITFFIALISICLCANGQGDIACTNSSVRSISNINVSKQDVPQTLSLYGNGGKMTYKHGKFTLREGYHTRILDKEDLKILLSENNYLEYQNAKKKQYASIPLWILSAGCATSVGLSISGITAYARSFNNSIYMVDEDKLFFSSIGMLCGSIVATAAFLAPSIALTVSSKHTMIHIADDYNRYGNLVDRTPVTIGAATNGIGFAIHF